jgi:hypothetical protein
MRLNKLTNDCDYIFAGETLTVPLTDQRITMSETDLDCDGKDERIRLIPTPGENLNHPAAPETTIDTIPLNQPHLIKVPPMPLGPQSMDPVYGVVVETLSPLGFYQEVWHYTIADTGDDFFYLPKLVDSGGCEIYLSIDRLGEGTQVHHEVFSWNGFGMDLFQETSP